MNSALIPFLLLSHTAQATQLTVYSYESFVSKWGPGPTIQKAFEQDCACTVQWVNSEDGAALLARLRLEGANTRADVVVGLDENLVPAARDTKLFAKFKYETTQKLVVPVNPDPEGYFVPYDFGWFAFMYDSEKIKNVPKSLKELIEKPEYAKKVLIQDPRTSTPGLGLLVWLNQIYGAKSTDALSAFSRQVLTVTKGWSEAYGLFTKGEAPLVLSYTTSEAYHKSEEKTARYKALIFSEGHPLQIEVAGLIAGSKNQVMAKKFLNFLLDKRSQTAMAAKNWMYPVVDMATLPNIPAAFLTLPKPSQTLPLAGEKLVKQRTLWLDAWLAAFSKH